MIWCLKSWYLQRTYICTKQTSEHCQLYNCWYQKGRLGPIKLLINWYGLLDVFYLLKCTLLILCNCKNLLLRLRFSSLRHRWHWQIFAILISSCCFLVSKDFQIFWILDFYDFPIRLWNCSNNVIFYILFFL